MKTQTNGVLRRLSLPLILPVVLLFAACSFDYSDLIEVAVPRPDIVMEDLEYVRVRGGEHLVRFRAYRAERWEDIRMMELWDFSFEQLENRGAEVNAEGHAGEASVQLDTMNVSLREGVRINIESEDFIITTVELEWRDRERYLFGAPEDTVVVERLDGTSLSGVGFSMNLWDRTWAFSGGAAGTYVEDDDDDEDEIFADAENGQDYALVAESAILN